MTEDETYSYTVHLQRGKTSDRDKHKCTVSADTIDELQQKVEKVRDLMRTEIAKTRKIQGSPKEPDEDQATVGQFEGSA